MANSYLVGDFRGGEWSATAQGNIADPRYKIALSTCLNGIPIESGAWTRRPGTKNAGTTRGGAAARVEQLVFRETAPYSIEFTDGFLRFRSGIALVTTNDAQTVSAISSANPAVVQTAAAHGWSTGNTVIFPTLGTADPILLNRQFLITVIDTTHFSIQGAVTNTNIDGSTLSTFTTGTVARVMEFTTNYANQKWKDIRVVQAERTAILLHRSVAPQQITVNSLPTDASGVSFSLAASSFLDGPYFDPIGGGATVTPNQTTGNITLTVGFPAYDSTKSYSVGDFVSSGNVNYQSLTNSNLGNAPASSPASWVAVSAGIAVGPGGFQGSDIGRHVRMFSEPALWVYGTTYSAGNVVAYVDTSGATAYYTCLVGHTASGINAPGVSTSTWAINAAGALWTWGRITGLSNIISPSLSGSTNIGNATRNLNSAFDGVTNQDQINSANVSANNSSSLNFYVGKNYSGATAQKIASATVWPSSNYGFAYISSTGGQIVPIQFILNLRAKQTAPSSSSDGTLLASASWGDGTGQTTLPRSPYTLISNDQSTSWNYAWVEAICYVNGVATSWSISMYIAECQFFSPTGTGGGTGVTVQLVGPSLLYTTPIRTWRLGLYSDTTGYPSCGTYHEGRLWLSGSVDNRIDGSEPVTINQQGAIPLFTFSPTEQDGTVTDANGIAYTFDAPDVNAIFWMQPDLQGIVCGTEGGEWLVQATANNNILTPTSIQAHRVTRIGCANIEPRRTDHTLVFVQKYQRKIMEYFPDVFSGKFTAPNLSEKARHLTKTGIEQIAYQQELVPVIWARCGDGSLIGDTYKRDTLMTSQGPTISGWHRHTLGSGRIVESMCLGPNTSGTLDSLTMVTNDTATNVRHVEVLSDLFEEGSALTTAWFLDDAISAPAYATNIVMGGASGITIYGLWNLNGKTVTVFAGGLDCGDWMVSNGAVQVPFYPSPLQTNQLFTSTFVAGFSGAMPIVVGFTYTSQGQLVDPNTVPEAGTRNGPGLGKVKRAHKFAAKLVDTQGISFGTRFDNSGLHAAQLKSRGGNGTQLLAVNALFTGVHFDTVNDEGARSGNALCWQISRPFPATVAAIEPLLTTEDE